ncbi:MAG: flippase-like domain-containing protein [Polyangiaceae bacterium]|nr:flippase-like domain-containing protein [Myxococcales bacterium]MCB9584674.1 flippase-like domain-containing protein [Polyangiaceae bacterium]MCB9609111.1 flippase-like domain-containing protein [Polyangiaceae bacterium]
MQQVLSSSAAPEALLPPTRRAGRWFERAWARVLFSALGLGFVAFLLSRVDLRLVWGELTRLLPFVPLMILLESGRIAGEYFSTRQLSGASSEELPRRTMLQAHLMSYALSIGLPIGRLFAEGAKATLLARHIGGPRAAAVATSSHVLCLISDATFLVTLSALVWFLSGESLLTYAVVAQAALSCLLAAALWVLRRASWPAKALRRVPKAAAWATQMRAAQLPLGREVGRAMLGLLFGRTCQVACFLVALAVTRDGQGNVASLISASAGAQALNQLAGAVGDLMPAQLGVTDALFKGSAPLLGVSVETALAVAVAFHLVQLFWIGVGLASPYWFRVASTSRKVTDLESVIR